MSVLTLTINGKLLTAPVEPRTHLADFIREQHNLTGTHLGCEHGVCGACTILIDGVPVRSCITLAVACDGANITTIEGFDDDEIGRELRTAFSREHALQCGYCTPGMLISARDLVLRNDTSNEREIRIGMSGNLCRCTGYVGIIRAVQSVIADRRARGIKAISGGGRTELGPVGSGRAMASSGGATAPTEVVAPSPAFASEKFDLGNFTPQSTFSQSFTVPYPRAEVWAFFGRVSEVATCLPGVSLTGQPTDRHIEGQMRVKVGPITADFLGQADIDRDEPTYSGAIRGAGRDMRSQSSTRGEVRYRLHDLDDGRATRVDLVVGYTLTGALAQFSRGRLVQDIAGQLTRTFAANLEAKMSGKAPLSAQAAELNAFQIIWSVIKERMRGLRQRLRP